MTFDKFQECFCGCGQKIKYCAPKDLLNELDGLQRQIEGDQYSSALQKIERLEKKFGAHPTLLTSRCRIAAQQHATEKLREYAQLFLDRHPDNPYAHGWRSLAEGLLSDWDKAMTYFQHAVERTDKLGGPILTALQVMAFTATSNERFAAGCFLTQTLAQAVESEEGVRAAMEAHADEAPLPTKHPLEIRENLEGDLATAAKSAMDDIAHMRWRRALTVFLSLAKKHPKIGALRLMIARLMMLLGQDTDRIADQYRQYASLPDLTYVQRVAAHMYRIAHESPKSDRVVSVTRTWNIDDAGFWTEKLAASSRCLHRPESTTPSESPPPKAVMGLLDRDSEARPNHGKDAARVLGGLLVFGKETDNPARVVFVGPKPSIEEVEAFLKAIGDIEESGEEQHHEFSLLRTPPMLDPRIDREWIGDRLEAFLAEAELAWLGDRPLETFGGKTIVEAAQDPKLQEIVEAYVSLNELESPRGYRELRAMLNLPQMELGNPGTIPLVLALRIEPGDATDEQLIGLLHASCRFALPWHVLRYARECLARPDCPTPPEVLREAAMATPEQRLDFLDAAIARTPPEQRLNLGMMQLERFLMAMGEQDQERARDALQQAQSYADQPQVAKRLGEVLSHIRSSLGQAGVSPDAAGPPTPDTWSPGVASTAAPPPTPGDAPSKSKLWLPGQD